MQRVRRALLSVSNKDGLAPFAQGLVEMGVTLISTGGTARVLREAGLEVLSVSDVTGASELFDGRVKTLHPRIHGGILARRRLESDRAEMARHEIEGIDLVVVNLYPFRETVARGDVSHLDVLEQIDIGGPCMVRAAAKSHPDVGVVTRPQDYGRVLEAMTAHDGAIPDALRAELAAEAFLHTASYDAAIAHWMARETAAEPGPLPTVFGEPMAQEVVLRYGENPHQAAALYRPSGGPTGLAMAQQLQGKALSYNNYVDLDAAYAIARDLGETGVAVLKHTNPCGAARSTSSLAEAYDLARACDPTSSFGGIVSTAGVIDEALAERLVGSFLEVILAREVTAGAREILAAKKNLRVLTLPAAGWKSAPGTLQPRSISGGLLLQQADLVVDVVREAEVVTRRAPTDEEWAAMAFAWLVVRHVKSNAIVYARSDRTVGVGAGQMSRVDSSKIAVFKAQASLEGTAVASDAFFPFADGVIAAAEAGATAVIQPGGSIRDAEVIEAANAHDLTMVLTGRRHFRH